MNPFKLLKNSLYGSFSSAETVQLRDQIVYISDDETFVLASQVVVRENHLMSFPSLKVSQKADFVCSIYTYDNIGYIRILKNKYNHRFDDTVPVPASPEDVKQTQDIIENNLGVKVNYHFLPESRYFGKFVIEDPDDIFLLRLKGFIV